MGRLKEMPSLLNPFFLVVKAELLYFFTSKSTLKYKEKWGLKIVGLRLNIFAVFTHIICMHVSKVFTFTILLLSQKTQALPFLP